MRRTLSGFSQRPVRDPVPMADDLDRATSPSDPRRLLDRRTALRLLGGVSLGGLLAACGSSGDGSASPAGEARSSTTAATTPSSSAAASGTTETTTASATSCTLSPEMTEGPYYLDLDLVRRDVTGGRPGTPLALAFTVVDAKCAPIANAAVDIWHADAVGTYSGVGSQSGSTFLRGTQVTDASGKGAFTTIYPGWYQGRAVHIHVKVHVGDREVHTGQLFFPDSLNNSVFRSNSPYSTRGTPDTPNGRDNIFSNGGAASTLSPRADGSGYAADVTFAVQTS